MPLSASAAVADVQVHYHLQTSAVQLPSLVAVETLPAGNETVYTHVHVDKWECERVVLTAAGVIPGKTFRMPTS